MTIQHAVSAVSAVSDSETQLDYLVSFFGKGWTTSPMKFPISGLTLHCILFMDRWSLTDHSTFWVSSDGSSTPETKRESCQVHLLHVTPHFSHTRKGIASLTWAVGDWVFSSCGSSKTELWIWEEISLICHVLPICWRHPCWSSVGMLKCEHFYNVAGYGSCSW